MSTKSRQFVTSPRPILQSQAVQQTLITESKRVGVATLMATINADGSIAYSNIPITVSLSGDIYTVTHNLNLAEHSISLTGYEDSSNRDGRIVQILETATVDPNSLQVMILTGDNGTAADPVVLEKFELQIFQECDVVYQAFLVDGEGASSMPNSLDPANGKVVSDNFQDQQFIPFNLQVRNTTNSPVNWEAVIVGVPYDLDPNTLNLNGSSLNTTDNGDGTFTHVFSGSNLGAFSNIIITGGVVSPSGNGSGLSLYCESV